MTNNKANSAILRAAIRWTITRVVAAIVFFVAKSSLTLAAPCVVGNLQTYINLGQAGCTLGNLLFNDFQASVSSAPADPYFTPAGVTVNPDFISNSDVGLNFQGPWKIVSSSTDTFLLYIETVVSYQVTVISGDGIGGEALSINGAMVSGGTVDVREGTNNANLDVLEDNNSEFLTDGAIFPAVTSDLVFTDIFVSAGSFSSVSLDSATNLFTAVPEPSTWATMLLGFAVVGFAGFQRSRKRSAAQPHR
jgi:hypothetical protein